MIKKLEKIFKALGDKNRLRIINMLSVKNMCVCEITYVLGLSQSTVSGHLRVLADSNLIDSRKDGLWVEYSLSKNSFIMSNILIHIKRNMKDDIDLTEDKKKILKADRNKLCVK